MDVATIKGVIDRLTARGLTETSSDPEDGRRLLVSLTRAGQQMAEKAAPNALAITEGNAGAARRQGARDADGAAGQAAVIGPRQFQITIRSEIGSGSRSAPDRTERESRRVSTPAAPSTVLEV